MEEKIRKYVLQNAIRYDGKATAGAVIGKLLGESPELKKEMKTVSAQVRKIIEAVNTVPLAEQRAELERTAPELLEEKREAEVKTLPDLKNVKDNVVMRFAPSPSGPMHIGHAHGLMLNSELAKKYKGTFILRIEDTNPANIYPPAYTMIPEEADWMTRGNTSQVLIQSDRFDVYYKYVEELFAKNALYVCTCDTEAFRQLIKEKKACPCRELPQEEQKKRWGKMFDEYKKGDAVVRVKTDLTHKNPAMRDFPVWRINDDEHPRQGKKYRVWPLMNFAVFCDDVECGSTHIIRAKDHADNAKRQEYLYRYLDKPIPETLFLGRINFTDMRVSCSKTRPLIDDGTYTGWDDIKLPFLAALRRRGYQPEAFAKYAIHMGISLNDKKVSKKEYFKLLDAYNKECIDDASNRYFFVWNPIKITFEGAPERDVDLDLHPDHRKGGRKMHTAQTFSICKEDFDRLQEGKAHRLMDCLNFKKEGDTFTFVSQAYDDFRGKGGKLIHWVPEDTIPVEVVMDDGSVVTGLGEKTLTTLKVGDICQLTRFGFCRLDEIEGETRRFWFTHR